MQRATPERSPAPDGQARTDAADGRIELQGGASITFPSANGTQRATGTASAPPAAAPAPSPEARSGELVALSGQAGLYVVVVTVLVVLTSRWLLNHTWRAAITVAVMLLGVAVVGLLVVRVATDIGIVG